MLSDLEEKRLSVSFENVAACLSHHGQVPKGEYLVTTSVCHLGIDGTIRVCPYLSCCNTAKNQEQSR